MNRCLFRSFRITSAMPLVGLVFVAGCSGSTTTNGSSDNGAGGASNTAPSGQGGAGVGGGGATATAPVGGATGNASGGATVTGSGGAAPTATGGGSATSNGGANATGGSSGKATGGTTATSTGGAGTSGGAKATGDVTSSTGGAKATGGVTSSTGGAKATGGVTSSTGGAPAAGGSSSTCGSTTPNQNPFGCAFAWGLSDPGGSLSAYSFLQFVTLWIDWGIAADGTISTCVGCNWLKNTVSATSIVPVYYGYIIGYYAHANGIVDGNQCPANNPNCPNLTNDGAAFVRTNRSKIVQAYADYAKQSYAVWPTKPLVWLLEGDFVQFTASSQSSPFTMAELAKLAADITCAIKGNMPNAVVAINHSTWNQNQVTNDYWAAMKSAGVNYDMAWTTGVANANGFFNSSITASSYNGSTATYTYLHQVSGRKIFIDDGCGAQTNEDWSTSTAATLNARISSGVAAFNHCGSLKSTYQSLTTALKSQLNSTCN